MNNAMKHTMSSWCSVLDVPVEEGVGATSLPLTVELQNIRWTLSTLFHMSRAGMRDESLGTLVTLRCGYQRTYED